MHRVWLFSVVIALSFGLLAGAVCGQEDKKPEKKKEEEILGKMIGEWIKILREHENPKFRRAALIAIEYGGAARGTGLATVIEALEKDKEPLVRQEAVAVLGRLGPDGKGALKALVLAMQNDKADSVREAAATAIGNKFASKADEYISAIIEALKDPHPGTRIAVATTLRNMGKEATPAIPALLEAAKNAKEPTLMRIAAVHVISRHGKDNPQTLPLLLDLVNNTQNANALRAEAVDGLARAGSDDPDLLAALSKVLDEKSVELRKASAIALGTLGAKARSAWPAVKTRVSDPKEDSSVRNHLIRLTGTLAKANSEAVPILITVAEKDDSTENRIAAIQELAELGALAKSAIDSLTRIAQQDARAAIRDEASKALRRIRGG